MFTETCIVDDQKISAISNRSAEKASLIGILKQNLRICDTVYGFADGSTRSKVGVIRNPGEGPIKTLRTVTAPDIRAAADAYGRWRLWERDFTDDPSNKPEAVKRVKSSYQTGVPLKLFIPWGIRPSGVPVSEEGALEQIQIFCNNAASTGLKLDPLVMFADEYASKINRYDPEQVQDYMDEISSYCRMRDISTTTWSRIKQENPYPWTKIENDYDTESILSSIPTGIKTKYREAAEKRSNDPDTNSAVDSYLIERVREAALIDAIYKPIKYSCVAPVRDYCDGELPRIYALPVKFRYPWLSQ